MLNIQTPIATWVMARLYDENHPVPRKDLLRHLCQASFDSMNNDNDFAKTMEELTRNKYIEHTRETFEDLIPIRESNAYSLGSTTTKMQQITRTREGYVITDDGIIAFRKQIATPLEKIKRQVNRLPPNITTNEKFKNIVDKINSNSSMIQSAIQLCIDNAPSVIDFIKIASGALGIPIQ